MLALALESLSVSPLLTSITDPSTSVLDFGVEAAAAPPRKPFGWDAYWGAADMHAGPSYSFARQRTKIADANALAQTRSVPASTRLEAALAYPPLGELMAVQTCMPLANCCSRSVPTAYGRRWTDECVEGAANIEYCPLGTPFGNVGWRPAEGWCGKDHRTGNVCTSCTCCCPDAPPDACLRSYPTRGPTPALTPALCDDPKAC